LVSRIEQPTLRYLAQHMPAWVSSDHLTLLGFISMFLAGLAYALSYYSVWWLLGVDLALILNWFGDSLDGALARYRRRCRPCYGYYVDHMVDAFGATFLMGGLACSGFMSPGIALGLLLGYALISIHIYLATHVLGVFKISYASFGGTELRLMLILANALLWLMGASFRLWGHAINFLDAAGVVVLVGMAGVIVSAAIRCTHTLYHLEPLPPQK
jgi:phosphatidylglycerophosphate synthase